jgi:hypothetical protein
LAVVAVDDDDDDGACEAEGLVKELKSANIASASANKSLINDIK